MTAGMQRVKVVLVCFFMIFTAQLTDNAETNSYCRVSGGLLLNANQFEKYSCARCYQHMDTKLFTNGTKFQQHGVWLVDPLTNELYEPTYTNISSPIFETFRSEKLKDLWINCCQAAVKCCQEMTSSPHTSDSAHCPKTWDGWNCWKDSQNGTKQRAACPSYIYFHSDAPTCTRYAEKTCWSNASWYKNYKGNEYTEYSTCGQDEDIKVLLKAHVITFSISIVLLIPAIVIFFFYRQLHSHRIKMHKNLFISLLLTAVFVVVFESYFIINSINSPEDSVLESNTVGCKIFYTLTKYLRLTTYMWMFCEGFYLHKLLAASFAEQKGMLMYHVIGWGFPVVPVSIWAAIRQVYSDGLCWTVPVENYEWIMFIPMLLALVINFGFLAHIVKIIITKLRSSHVDEPAQFRRTVKATMVLVPLFGLHFLFLSYHPNRGDCHFLQTYNIITYSMDGLQGGLVSLLFCYLNNEVLQLLKRSYSRRKMTQDIENHMKNRKPRNSRTSVLTNCEVVPPETPLKSENK